VADRPLVEVLETPALDGPVLLLALDGWIDAAGAAAEARQRLLEGDPGVGSPASTPTVYSTTGPGAPPST
jgi:hypothetical protein